MGYCVVFFVFCCEFDVLNYCWIFFDVDDMLFYFDVYQGLWCMFECYVVDFIQVYYVQYQEINKLLWVYYQNGIIIVVELQIICFESWVQQFSVSVVEFNEVFLLVMVEICILLFGVQVLIDVFVVVQVCMGVIINGFIVLQFVWLECIGLCGYFDLLVIFEQVGVVKLDVCIFEYVLVGMGDLLCDQVLMVGDNLYLDIVGGFVVGLYMCWFNLYGYEVFDGIMLYYQVCLLFELQVLLLG